MKRLLKQKREPGAVPKNMIPLSIPVIKGNEWKYIKECLDTGWVSSVGKFVNQFEERCAKLADRKYGIACVNGTAALHISLLVAGIKENEEVIMPSLSFAAPAFAVRYVGAWPTFVDVDPDIWQLDPKKVQEFIDEICVVKRGKLINRKTKRVVSGILPVHLLGHPVDMAPLLKISRQYKLTVIEDAAESIGALYRKKKVGSLGDLAVFSFNGNKIITCGGGGMIVTNNQKWAKKARYLTTQAKDDSLEYVHNEVGYNYRLTNIQAAFGLAQLEKLSEYIKIKKRISKKYDQALDKINGLSVFSQAKWAEPNSWLYTVLVDLEKFGKDSRQVHRYLKKTGIDSRPLWHPLHNLTPFKGAYAYKISYANEIVKNALSLPCSVNLSSKQQDKVIQVIKRLSSE